MDDSKFDVNLSNSWDEVDKEYFIKPLTFTIEPVSMTGLISDFYIDIEIKMSNGDKILYYYKGDECPINKVKCRMMINGQKIEVDSDNGFLDEIRKKYLEYLKIL
jgi:hypothetical protein